MVQQLPGAVVGQVSGDGCDHKEERICLQPAKEMIMQIKSLTELLEKQKKRLDLWICGKGLKDVCDICSILIIAAEDRDIDDQISKPFTEDNFDAVHFPAGEDEVTDFQFCLSTFEGTVYPLKSSLKASVLIFSGDEVDVNI